MHILIVQWWRFLLDYTAHYYINNISCSEGETWKGVSTDSNYSYIFETNYLFHKDSLLNRNLICCIPTMSANDYITNTLTS